MVKDAVTGRNKSIQKIINVLPKDLRLRFNPRRYSIESFVKYASKKIGSGSRVLDAGAGPCPYKSMFAHTKYEATDFTDPHGLMDFTCSLDNIPKKANTYDSVLCTEVIEHVEYPQKVIDELYRILKKNGKLFLTTPQQYMLHQKPYNFYYFTKYGLASLLKNAGFKNFKIYPQGGFFWTLGDMIRHNNVSGQYKKRPYVYYPMKILAYPFTQILIPFILFHLDSIDREKDWTMGYNVEAVK